MKQLSRNKIISIALCMGFFAAVLAYAYLSRQPGASRMVAAVVADRSIPNGTILESGMFQMRLMPSRELPTGAAATPDAVIGKVAAHDIKPGEAISLSSVSEKSKLSQIVKPFMRAVTVALDPIVGVGGFLKPGDHVDVLATFNVNEGTVTKTVLQDIQLIAIGSEIVDQVDPEGGKKAKPQVQTSATLALLPMDAEKLVLADSKGKLRLTLRRADDLSYVPSKGVTGRGLMGPVPPDAPQPKQSVSTSTAIHDPYPARMPVSQPSLPIMPAVQIKPMAVPAAADVKIVQVIRGTKVEDTEVPD